MTGIAPEVGRDMQVRMAMPPHAVGAAPPPREPGRSGPLRETPVRRATSLSTGTAGGALCPLLWLALVGAVHGEDRVRAGSDIEKDVRAALEHDPRVHPRRSAIDIELQAGAALLAGELEDIEEKRAAVELAKQVEGVARVDDRLRVRPTAALGDGTIRDAVRRQLLEEPSFQRMVIHCRVAGSPDAVERAPDAPEGRLEVAVAGGVVTLSGEVWSRSRKRLAAVLAWRAPGCRNVVNELQVRPVEHDTDGEIRDAVELVLNKDPIVHSGQIDAQVRDGRVTLRGMVATREEKRMAERDVWYIEGVCDVVNALEVYQGPAGQEAMPAAPPGFE